MSTISRREFQQQTLGSLLTWSLLETLFLGDAFAEEVKPIAAKWLAELNSLSLDLKGKKLDPLQCRSRSNSSSARLTCRRCSSSSTLKS